MKLLIDIPKEFEQHFQTDGFEDSLHRLSADAHLLAGNYERETAVMLIEAFASAVPIPSHGRLIDADALLTDKSMSIIGKGMIFGGQYVFSESEIVNAPTIIEADLPKEE